MLNKVMLIGHLGADPEIRNTANGNRLATFSLATSERWRDKATGEKREKTEWHRIVIFSEGLVKVAEQYLKKGSKLYLEGQLSTRKWEDQSGAARYSTEVVLQGFNAVLVMLDSHSGSGYRPGGGGPSDHGYDDERATGPSPSSPPPGAGDLDDEIPF